MAKEIVWTEAAVKDRYKIYLFWLSHIKSDLYSTKLELLFSESAKLIAEFPGIGTPTDFEDIRVKVVRNYKLFYRNGLNRIEVLRVWASEQDPEEFFIT